MWSHQSLTILTVIGSSLDLAGKLMVSYTALAVHNRFWKEHRIDDLVFTEMHKESKVGLIGILFMILGFLLQLPGKLFIL